MQQLSTNTHHTPRNTNALTIQFTRNGYRPHSVPAIRFEDEVKAAIVLLGENESVEDVLSYHYPRQYKDVQILRGGA